MPDTGSHSVDKEENKSLISDEAPIHAYKRLLAYDHDWDYTYFIVTLCQQKALYHICKFSDAFPECSAPSLLPLRHFAKSARRE